MYSFAPRVMLYRQLWPVGVELVQLEVERLNPPLLLLLLHRTWGQPRLVARPRVRFP